MSNNIAKSAAVQADTFGRVMTSTFSTIRRKDGGILLRIRCWRNSCAPWNRSPPPTTSTELYIFLLVSSDAVRKKKTIEDHFCCFFTITECRLLCLSKCFVIFLIPKIVNKKHPMQCVLNVGMGLYWYSLGKILANQIIKFRSAISCLLI